MSTNNMLNIAFDEETTTTAVEEKKSISPERIDLAKKLYSNPKFQSILAGFEAKNNAGGKKIWRNGSWINRGFNLKNEASQDMTETVLQVGDTQISVYEVVETLALSNSLTIVDGNKRTYVSQNLRLNQEDSNQFYIGHMVPENFSCGVK